MSCLHEHSYVSLLILGSLDDNNGEVRLTVRSVVEVEAVAAARAVSMSVALTVILRSLDPLTLTKEP